jgi:two-component system response regulator
MSDERSILLVEDNPSDVALTRRALERARIVNQLIVVEDGQEALDLRLPKIPGIEVLRRLRADPRTRRLPVVILTSSQEEQDLAAGYDLGANSYIRKPVDFQQFQLCIEQLGLYWLIWNEPPPPAR